MFDELLEVFERDRKHPSGQRRRGIGGLLDRLTGKDHDDDRYDARSDRRRSDDDDDRYDDRSDRRRPDGRVDDRYEARSDRRRDDDDHDDERFDNRSRRRREFELWDD